MNKLLVISSAPVQQEGDTFLLDAKFLEGMRAYCTGWDGPVQCILQKTGGRVPFGSRVHASDLPFKLTVLAPEITVGQELVADFDVVLCSGDSHRYLHLAGLFEGTQTRIFYIIEYILETRLQIIRIGAARNQLQKAASTLWTRHQERRRRRAFKQAYGVQANGYPAAAAYGPLNGNTLRYLDNRVGQAQLASSVQMDARQTYLDGSGPLRLIHSGRLAPMKGSQDLVPIARALRDKGVDYRLDVFGSGTLEDTIRAEVIQAGLQDRVHLHGTVDFQSELVPFTRDNSDIFLSCHRQSDPSCSYLEAMGCGVAVVGYSNRMWQALQGQSEAGWVAPLGDAEALATLIADAAADRAEVARRCSAARSFAQDYSFETEFGRRIAHLTSNAGAADVLDA
jgi:colanic acid/amylovoran biosynthesis glycosyltransferase